MTQAQLLLLDLIISNAIRLATSKVNSMTPAEVDAAIKTEEERKAKLMEGI